MRSVVRWLILALWGPTGASFAAVACGAVLFLWGARPGDTVFWLVPAIALVCFLGFELATALRYRRRGADYAAFRRGVADAAVARLFGPGEEAR